ncbi:uncharacterized protein LOC141680984 [Apium graveolens]|uniref:uncharacterized protein LOC141680984 n=1 Tax=Apium graveolens TaxID=4045 RepID=UPI003D79374F
MGKDRILCCKWWQTHHFSQSILVSELEAVSRFDYILEGVSHSEVPFRQVAVEGRSRCILVVINIRITTELNKFSDHILQRLRQPLVFLGGGGGAEVDGGKTIGALNGGVKNGWFDLWSWSWSWW